MARRKTAFEVGGYYHIFNRGANRANVFLREEHYGFFLNQLAERSKADQV